MSSALFYNSFLPLYPCGRTRRVAVARPCWRSPRRLSKPPRFESSLLHHTNNAPCEHGALLVWRARQDSIPLPLRGASSALSAKTAPLRAHPGVSRSPAASLETLSVRVLAHRPFPKRPYGRSGNGAPGRTRTCNPRLSLPLQFSLPREASLWSGLSLHRLRCCTYSLYGALR